MEARVSGRHRDTDAARAWSLNVCRICGVIFDDRYADSDLRHRILRAMRDTMAAGGPDDAGEFHDGNVSLGHRRLSIIDLSPMGHQPFVSTCGRYVLTFNGEMYNFREVRAELEGKGHGFRSESDTEVLLCALIEWGADCLALFRGMFAFALYDRRERSLLLARDRAGVKPLYYWIDGHMFAFASEPKAFHAIPAFERRVDEHARTLFFKYGYVPAPRSIFKGVYKLPPGHVLRVDVRNPAREHVECYWDVRKSYAAPKRKGSYAQAVDELEQLLIESFNLRMVADVPVGMFLSGGVDSSTVLALLSRHSAGRIKTFTIGFEYDEFNEAPQAREVAGFFGADHHELILGERECRAIIPRLADIWDEPFGDSSQIPTLLVSEFARRNVKVSLSADGGDETFYGYPKYWLTEARHGVVRRLRWLLKPMRFLGDKGLQKLGQAAGIGGRLAKAVSVAAEAGRLADTLTIGEEVFSPSELGRLFGGEVAGPRVDDEFGVGAWRIEDPVDEMLAVDYRTYLPDDILCKVDRATMAVGLEGREPILDHKIIEFAAGLPIGYKRDGTTTKRILREVLFRYAPRDLIERPKMGFGVPVERWMRTDPQLRDRLEWYLSPAMLTRAGFRDPGSVRTLLRHYLDGGSRIFKKLWLLYSYQTWFERWGPGGRSAIR